MGTGGTVTGVVTPAVVFQEDRLCPQLTAVDNLVLTGHGLTAAQARSDLRSLGFTEADLRLPAVRLSGGTFSYAEMVGAYVLPSMLLTVALTMPVHVLLKRALARQVRTEHRAGRA